MPLLERWVLTVHTCRGNAQRIACASAQPANQEAFQARDNRDETIKHEPHAIIVKTVIQLILYTATIALVGYGLTHLIFRRVGLSRLHHTTLTLGFGLSLAPLLMFALGLTGVPLTLTHVLLLLSPFMVLSVVVGWKRCSSINTQVTRAPLSSWETTMMVLILGSVLFAFVFAMSKPFDVWDAVTTWGFKAHVLYHEETVYTESLLNRADALTRIQPRPQYPLGWPLQQHLVALFLGRFEAAPIKFVVGLFFGLLMLATYTTARLWFPRPLALLGCTLLLSLPFIYYQSVFRTLLVGGKKSAILGGLADLPLACFVLLSLTALYRWFVHAEAAHLISAAVFSAAAAFTKNEGLALSAVIMVTLAFFIFHHRHTHRWRAWFLFASIWGILIGPWLWFRQQLPAEQAVARLEWSIEAVARLGQNVPSVIGFFLSEAANLFSWGLIWVLWLVLSLQQWRFIRNTALKYLYVIILGGLAADVVAVSLAPVGNVKRAFFESRAIARLWFQLAPSVVFVMLHLLYPQWREPTHQEPLPRS